MLVKSASELFPDNADSAAKRGELHGGVSGVGSAQERLLPNVTAGDRIVAFGLDREIGFYSPLDRPGLPFDRGPVRAKYGYDTFVG